jgi:hypothetical protein
MAGSTNHLRMRKNKPKVDGSVYARRLDYHEGLSLNQVAVILKELGLLESIGEFQEWLHGQTCPVIKRRGKSGDVDVFGVFEYDLFRWIYSKKTGIPPIWD